MIITQEHEKSKDIEWMSDDKAVTGMIVYHRVLLGHRGGNRSNGSSAELE